MASDLGLHCLPMSILWDAKFNGLTNLVSSSEQIIMKSVKLQ